MHACLFLGSQACQKVASESFAQALTRSGGKMLSAMVTPGGMTLRFISSMVVGVHAAAKDRGCRLRSTWGNHIRQMPLQLACSVQDLNEG